MPTSTDGPYLQLACICENLIEDKEGVLSLIRIIDRLNIDMVGQEAPAEIPEGFATVKLVLSFKAGSARGNAMLAIEEEEPSGLRRPRTKIDIFFEGGEDRGVNIVTNAHLHVKTQGLYWFNIYLEDQLVTKVPLRIVYRRLLAPGQK